MMAVTALTVTGLGAMTAAPASAAPGDPFPAADPLVFVAQGLPTGLYQAVTDSSGTVSFEPEGPVAPMTYNALAYNPADNYLYAMTLTEGGGIPAYSFVRVGQDGAISRVGESTYVPDGGGGWNAATIGPDGNYWVGITSGDNSELLVIDPSTGALVRQVTMNVPQLPVPDITLADGYLWGMMPTSDATGSLIYRIDPNTGTVTSFPSPVAPPDSFAGASWTFGNGNLGFSSNTTGVVSQIQVTDPGSPTPTFTLVSQSPGPASGNNDGAASPGLPTDLSIVKDGPTAVVPGGTVTYTLTVTNNGPGNSSGFSISDPVPAPLTNVTSTSPGCTVADDTVTCVGGRTLAGESATYTITADVPATLTDPVANSATVTANEEDPTPGNDSSSHTVSPATLSVVKQAGTPVDANADGVVSAGDTIAYSFTVTNTGDVPLENVAVDDAKAGAVTCPQASLAPGASQTCTADEPYTITDADTTAGSVDNSATATGTTPDGATVTSTPSTTTTPTGVPAPDARPGLRVVKKADVAKVKAGRTITYSFRVTNTGNVTITNPRIDERSFTGSGRLSAITCPASASTLTPNESVTCTAKYTVTKADVRAGSIKNTATATGTTPAGLTPPVSPPSSTTVTTVPDVFRLAVHKRALGSSRVLVGEKVRYRITVTNKGPDAASAPVRLRDRLPQGLELVRAHGSQWSCTANKATDVVSCRRPHTLRSGKTTRPVIVVARATKAAVGHRVVNVATAGAAGTKATVRSNQAVIRVQRVPPLPHTGFRDQARQGN